MADQRTLMEALRDLLAADATMRHRIARAAGLGDHEMVALQHLGRSAVGPAELSRLLGVSTAASTGIVDRLAARGHVVRRAHAGDRRRTEVHLTESGRAEVLAHLSPMLSALRRLDEDFTNEEKAVVERYLRGATAALQQISSAESPGTRPSPPRPPRRPTAR